MQYYEILRVFFICSLTPNNYIFSSIAGLNGDELIGLLLQDMTSGSCIKLNK